MRLFLLAWMGSVVLRPGGVLGPCCSEAGGGCTAEGSPILHAAERASRLTLAPFPCLHIKNCLFFLLQHCLSFPTALKLCTIKGFAHHICMPEGICLLPALRGSWQEGGHSWLSAYPCSHCTEASPQELSPTGLLTTCCSSEGAALL